MTETTTRRVRRPSPDSNGKPGPKRKGATTAPTGRVGEIPEAPAGLGGAGQAEWQRTWQCFFWLDPVADLGVVTALCQAVQDAHDCRAILAREGRTVASARGVTAHPVAAQLLGSEALAQRVRASLGITPAERQKSGRSLAPQGPIVPADAVPEGATLVIA